MASLAATITAAPTCADCVFGATSTTKYSYTVHTVQTVNVTVIPHVTTFSNAPNITSYETLTQIDTIYVGGENGTATGAANATTFNSPGDITWTVGDATLTYPTTYVQYLGFAGAAPSNAACAEDINAKRIEMPQSTATFIYPYNKSVSTLPLELLDYLGTLPTITEQLDDAKPATCAPLTITPSPSIVTSNSRREAKRYEGARRADGQSQVVVEVGGNNDTHWLWQRQASGGAASSGFVPTGFGSSTSFVTSSLAILPSSEAQATTASFRGPANDHTTAFVLNTITGEAIVVPGNNTAEPAVIGQPTPTNDNVQRPTSPDDENNQSPQPTQQPSQSDNSPGDEQSPSQQGPNVSNILQLLPSVIDAQNSAENPAPTQGGGDEQAAPNSGGLGSSPDGSQHQDTQPAATQAHVFNVGTNAVSANSEGNVQIGTQVLTPGQTIDVGSGASPTAAFVQTYGGSTRLVVGDSTYRPVEGSAPAATAAPAVITADGQTYTAVQNGESLVFAGGSSTFAFPAGSATTVRSVQVSAAADGSAVVVDGSTIAIPQTTPAPGAVITAGDQTFSVAQSDGSIMLVDGTSTIQIVAGSRTVVDGQTFSVGPSGNAIIVDGTTVPVPNAAASPTPTEMIVSANGNTFTAVDESGSVILKDGSSTITLEDGSQTTFEGQTVSALPNGDGVVVDGSITTRFGSTSTPTGVGDYINSGLGSNPTSTGGSAGDTPESGANRVPLLISASTMGLLVAISVLL